MNKQDVTQLKEGVRLFNMEMKRISKIIKEASDGHKKRFEKSSKTIHNGMRMTDGRL